MRTADFDYELGEERIARYPSADRDGARLMIVRRDGTPPAHGRFRDILSHLNAGDCLLLNDSKVLPARLFGLREDTGAKVEFLLVRERRDGVWETLAKPGKKLRPGDRVRFAAPGADAGDGFRGTIRACGAGGVREVAFEWEGDFSDALDRFGVMPLPPYIGRAAEASDRTRYQTVYSRAPGSVAAPTAGLHFTDALLDRARERGVRIAKATLHVGPGTFRPVQTDDIDAHRMHTEAYEIDADCAAAVNETKAAGGRVICVGTTSARAAESAAVRDASGAWRVAAGRGETDIFIKPGYDFKILDALITNFHLPKSTLLMLVSALCGRERLLDAYRIAAEAGYGFLSYGDAMLVL